jgi:hypothetical protein
MNPMYSQSYAHYNTQPQSLQPPPQWSGKLVTYGWNRVKFWKFHELHPLGSWQLGYAFLLYNAEVLVHSYQLQAKWTSIFWCTTYQMFIGSGLYEMAVATDHTPLVRNSRIATHLLVVVVLNGDWQQQVATCALREKGAVATPYLTYIGGETGFVVVWCEYVLPSKSKVQQLLPASMVSWRRLLIGFV